MTENVTVVEEPTEPTKARFNARKALKITGAATAAVALVVLAKRKLNGSVDGALTATVETDSQS